jgi:cytosine/uracil/thiamine/allantoin permease
VGWSGCEVSEVITVLKHVSLGSWVAIVFLLTWLPFVLLQGEFSVVSIVLWICWVIGSVAGIVAVYFDAKRKLMIRKSH